MSVKNFCIKEIGLINTENINFFFIYYYYSIRETDWSEQLIAEMHETEWQCQNCDFQAILMNIEKLQHQDRCTVARATSVDKQSESVTRKPNSQAYECPDCSQTLYLTPIEILKHKKLHIKTS